MNDKQRYVVPMASLLAPSTAALAMSTQNYEYGLDGGYVSGSGGFWFGIALVVAGIIYWLRH